MSKMADLSYDIEQLFIEGYSALSIAALIGCELELVENWIKSEGLALDQAQSQRGEDVFASMVKDLA